MSGAIDLVATVHGIGLHYRDWGGHGTAILLLHGLASNAHIWDAVAPELAADFRVVGLDQRGHGTSDKPEDGYDFATVCADVEAFVAAMGWRRAVVVGHSWGGNVALQFGATYPDATAGLVFVDGGFLDLRGTDGMDWERVEIELAPPDLTSMTMDELLASARTWNAETGWSKAVEATIRGSFRSAEDGKIRPQLARENHMRILRSLWEQDPPAHYPLVKAPTLLIPAYRHAEGKWAAYQERKRVGVEVARNAIGDARVVEMDDTIHDVPLHPPPELAQAIREFAAGLTP